MDLACLVEALTIHVHGKESIHIIQFKKKKRKLQRFNLDIAMAWRMDRGVI